MRLPLLERVRLVVAIVRDVLLIALMLAFVILGGRVVKAAHDVGTFYDVPSATLPADRCGGGVC